METAFIKEIIQSFREITNFNEIEIIYFLLIIAITLWLYKELKTQQLNELEKRESTIKSSMEAMASILHMANKIKRSKNKDALLTLFYESVYEAYPFLDYKIYKKVDGIMKSLRQEEEKVEIITDIVEEAYIELSLKKRPILRSEYLVDDMEKFVTKLLLIFIPLLQSIGVFLLLSFLFLLGTTGVNTAWKVIKPSVFVILLFQLVFLVDLIRLKHLNFLGIITFLLSLSSGYAMLVNEGITSLLLLAGWIGLIITSLKAKNNRIGK